MARLDAASRPATRAWSVAAVLLLATSALQVWTRVRARPAPPPCPVAAPARAVAAASAEPSPLFGGGYQPVLPIPALERGVASYGDLGRARRFVAKLAAGGRVTIAVLGGSITNGQGVSLPNNTYSERLRSRLAAAFPSATVELNKRGVIPATPSAYMALCLEWHVADADLVVLEYNINDGGKPGDTPLRRGHEQLVRRVLALPSRPAVVEAIVFRWPGEEWEQLETPYTIGGDTELVGLSLYYHLPAVSLRSLLWERAFPAATKTGSWPHSKNVTAWMADADHPNDAGHAALADMILVVLARAAAPPVGGPAAAEEEDPPPPLPAPMFRDNWPVGAGAACLMGDRFKALAAARSGFEWVNEGDAAKPRWGWVANRTGDWIEWEVDTSSRNASDGNAAVGVAHLRSYEGMGVAEVTCVGGCACEPLRVDGRHEARNSQTFIAVLAASRAPRCRLRATVLADAGLGGKVKLVGSIILGGGDVLAINAMPGLVSEVEGLGIFSKDAGGSGRR